jgi:copper resistance protein C
MRRLLGLASLLAALLAANAAQAHAMLDHASPPVGSTVAMAPRELILSFTQKLEPAFSSIEVTGPGGARVDDGKAQVNGNTMRIGVKAAGPGTYRVRWRALSVDTHSTQGSFTFRVGGGGGGR